MCQLITLSFLAVAVTATVTVTVTVTVTAATATATVTTTSTFIADSSRDLKIWYGEAIVRRQMVKITSGDVMSRVPLQLSRRSLAFFYGKVPSFTYSSVREYKPAVYLSF